MPDPTVKIPGGFEVPITRWAITGFSLVAVVAIAFGAYRYFYPVEPELVSVKQAKHRLELEVREYNKHIVDAPVIALDDVGKTIHLAAFDDGCLVVSRKFAGRSETHLLLDPSRTDLVHTDGDRVERRWPAIEAVVEAAGRCLNPHPGRFAFHYGNRVDACWVEGVRDFEDGCEHVQMFNTCANAWASNPDGSPQIRWTRCLH